MAETISDREAAELLGPATERLLAAAFSSTLLINASTAAGLLGLDVKTLKAMTDERVIRAVRRGTLRAYTEGDIRDYLTKGAAPCRSTRRREAPISTSTSSSKVVAFTARHTSKAGARPNK